MSELTECNYCTLRAMMARAKARGEIITTRPAKNGGVECATHKPEEKPTRWDTWFMELPDHCCC